jgi:hypothetical protein
VPEIVAYSSGRGSDVARPIRLRMHHMTTGLRFTIALQRSCQHKRQAVRLYRALAEREDNALRRALLLTLAMSEEHRGRRYAVWLEQLGAPVLEDRESLGDRWWRWVLVRCGVAGALAWTEWVDRWDRWCLLTLLSHLVRGNSAHRGPRQILSGTRDHD